MGRLGGQVTRHFDNLDAIAVDVPIERLQELVAAAGPGTVKKDVRVTRPRRRTIDLATAAAAAARRSAGGTGSSAAAGTPPPAAFDALGGAGDLHAQGMKGQDVVIAVIDDGIAMDPMMSLRSNASLSGGWVSPIAGVTAVRPVLGNRVIGGESFVPADIDPTSATRLDNDAHGTVVSVMAAGDGALVAPDTEPFMQSMRTHMPDRVAPCPGPPFEAPCGPDASVVSVTGTAPGARLYAFKTFAADGGGTAQMSWMMAALDRTITLRRNFNRGVPVVPVAGTGTPDDPFVYDSLRIDVVNMSFGGLTAFAGRDEFDQLLHEALAAGIVPVAAAANDGPAAMTVTSPGTSFAALTVGAIDAAPTDRVWEDLDFGLGIGLLSRPSNHLQAAYFSSRGPTADGRLDPDLAALGLGNLHIAAYAETTTGTIDFCNWFEALPGTCQATAAVSAGTSYAAPLVAGAAALLRREVPRATAVQIRNALQAAADPAVFGDGNGPIDRGAGALDVSKALQLLRSGRVSNVLPDLEAHRRRATEDPADALGRGGRSVIRNVQEAGFTPIAFINDVHVQRLTGLTAGQTAHLFIPSDPSTTRVTVELTNLTSDRPPSQHNALVGERALVHLIDAPTGWAPEWEYAWERIGVGAGAWSRAIDAPQTGLLRLAIQGDQRNAGRISATVTIRRERAPRISPSAAGRVKQDDFLWFDFEVPAGAQQLSFEAAWRQNWARYPTNDVDMYVIDPAGNLYAEGVTLNSPERVVIDGPAPGRWSAVVAGFTVYRADGRPDNLASVAGRVDEFALRVAADGQRLTPTRSAR